MSEQTAWHNLADVLGLEHRKTGYALVDLSEVVAKGLPLSSLETVHRLVAPDMANFSQLVTSSATLKRRRTQRQPLNATESQRLARIARVWARALDVYQDDDEIARAFLRRPHPLLHQRTPLDVAAESDLGAQAVEDILGRLEYGSVA